MSPYFKSFISSTSLLFTVLFTFVALNSHSQNKIYQPLFDNSNFNRSIDLSKPVGTISGEASVSSTGGANYSIPISLPPGTNGHIPSLSVNYNSHGSNGVLGYGWSISGLSAITRSRKNWYHEPDNVGPTENLPSDKYSLDGSRLMLLNGTYGMAGSEYGTEVENYARIEAQGGNVNGPDWFRVVSKEGVIMEYGNSPTSQVIHSHGHKVMWRLNKVIDRNGNYYEYVYDNTDDASRIKEIKFTGNTNTGLIPYNHIYFDYSVRLDQNTVYEAGLGYNLKYILDSIRVTAEGGLKFKKYSFNHGYDDIYSFLTEITEEGSDGTQLNSTIFKYGEQAVKDNFYESTNNCIQGLYMDIMPSGDFDGDGFEDLLGAEHHYHVNTGIKIIDELKIYKRSSNNAPMVFSTGTGQLSTANNPVECYNKNNTLTKNLNNTVADFNGDGRDDLLTISTKFITPDNEWDVDKIEIYFPNSDATSLTKVNHFTPSPPFTVISNSNREYLSVGDFDGDGRSDFITYLQEDFTPANTPIEERIVYTQSDGGTGTSFIVNKPYTGSVFSKDNSRNFTIDFDGDGKSEILNVNRINPNTGSVNIYKIEKVNSQYQLVLVPADNMFVFAYISTGDFNGDGKTDLFLTGIPQTGANNPRVHWILYSTGEGWTREDFIPHKDINVNFPPQSDEDELLIADYNGDGKSDIAHIYDDAGNANVNIYFSTGNSFVREHDLKTSISSYPITADYNGDGRKEIIYRNHYNYPFHEINIKHNKQERILQEVKNGINSSTTFTYESINKGPYSRNIPSTNPYPLNYISAPIYNVISTESPNGIGGSFVKEYRYEDAMIHRAGRGFMGYKKFIEEDLSTNIKQIAEQEINTSFYIPLHDKTEIYRLDNNQLLNESNSSFAVTGLSSNRFKTELITSSSFDHRLGAGTTTTNTYDNFGNVVQSSSNTASGLETSNTTMSYIGLGGSIPFLPISSTTTQDRNSPGTVAIAKSVNFSYDAFGNLVTRTDFPGLAKEFTTSYLHNSYGRPTSKTVSAAGLSDREEQYIYDSKGRFLIVRTKYCSSCGLNGGSQTEYNDYDVLWGKPISTESSDCLTSNYEYDGFGRLVLTTLPNGSSRQKEYKWHPFGNMVYRTETSGAGLASVISYFDLLGREVKTLKESIYNHVVTKLQSFNNLGLLASQTNWYKDGSETPITTSFSYDALNRPLTESTSFSSKSYTYNYDVGNHWLRTRSTLPNGNFSESVVDAAGKTIQTEDPGGRVNFIYDSWGNKRLIAQNGVTVSGNKYDFYNHKIEHIAKNAGVITYDYDAFGQLISQTDASGNTHEFTYDALGRTIERVGPEGTTSYEYYCYQQPDTDPGGGGSAESTDSEDDNNLGTGGAFCCNNNLVKIIGFDGTLEEFEYDNLSRMTAKHHTINGTLHTTNYTYDNHNNLSTLTYPTGVGIEYFYDAQSNLVEIQRIGGPTIYKTNSANGMAQVTEYELGNGALSTNTYSHGFPTQFETPNIQNLEMTWDMGTGNLTTRRDNIITGSESFTYDILNRLSSSQVGGLAVQNIDYDPFPSTGNSKNNKVNKTDAGNYSYTVPQIHTMSSIANPNSTTLPPNNISDQTQSLEYTGFQRVEQINEDGWSQDFDYWPSYNRVISNIYHNNNLEETRTYMGNYEIQELANTGDMNRIHYIDGPNGLCAIIVVDVDDNENIYYTYNDHLGSINKVTDASQNIVDEQSYDAWGRKRDPQNWNYYSGSTPAANNAWLYRGYTGHEHMPQFKLINMNARIYDPISGKLISPDNFLSNPFSSQAYNRYAYANNNPLVYTDPDGNLPLLAVMAIGAAISVTTNGINNISNGTKFFNNAGISAFMGAVGGALSFGIGGAASGMTGIGKIAFQTASHGYLGGIMSGGSGGSLGSGFVSGAFGSIMGTGMNHLTANSSGSIQTLGILGGGGISGGLSSSISGGNFIDGFRNGLVSTGLNHYGHRAYTYLQLRSMFNLYHKAAIEFEDDPAGFYERIGGPLAQWAYDSPQEFVNTCAAKLSLAMNYSGFRIPKGTPGAFEGGDGRYYFIQAKQMSAYLNRTSVWGTYKSYKNKVRNGVYFQGGFGGGVSGHLDVMYKGFPAGSYYDGHPTYIWR